MSGVAEATLEAVLSRGFERFYFLSDEGDLCVKRHPNGLLVVGLAPSHPLRSGSGSVVKLEFHEDISEKEAHGKRGRGGANVSRKTVIAEISLQDGSVVQVKAPFEAQLVELNSNLTEEPQLLQSSPEDEGFVAILQPRRPQDGARILEKLVDESGYAARQPAAAACSFVSGNCGPSWAKRRRTDA
ncbi:unnamed protein product [Effrenium voratum]|nr:unnamed protein product [Effrenium voratum]